MMYESLLDGLDDCRWNYLRGLADAAEDEGKPDLARGWRFMAKHHKWPMSLWHGWCFILDAAPLCQMAEHGLPVELYVEVRKMLEASEAGIEEEEVALESWVNLSKFMAVVAEAIGKELGALARKRSLRQGGQS
jgi:hypothetical protein